MVIDDGTVGALYKVEALPSLVVIGRDGLIRKSFVGYTAEGALDRALRDAVESTPTSSTPRLGASPRRAFSSVK